MEKMSVKVIKFQSTFSAGKLFSQNWLIPVEYVHTKEEKEFFSSRKEYTNELTKNSLLDFFFPLCLGRTGLHATRRRA